MKGYKFLNDLTSDVMFEAHGKDLKELFENSAMAMFSVICQLKKVEAVNAADIEVEAENASELLFSWLQALIAKVDIDEMFFSKFSIIEMDEKHLKAKAYGEPISPEKGGTVVKAVTNYGFKLEKSPEGYKAVVSLDI
ncbi:MAG: archease [Candidatus Woesearchaeota archaeon]